MTPFTREEITWYLGTVLSVFGLFGLLWRVTVGATIKRLEEKMVTREHLLKELMDLKEFLRVNFEPKREQRKYRRDH